MIENIKRILMAIKKMTLVSLTLVSVTLVSWIKALWGFLRSLIKNFPLTKKQAKIYQPTTFKHPISTHAVDEKKVIVPKRRYKLRIRANVQEKKDASVKGTSGKDTHVKGTRVKGTSAKAVK